jgi:hypothetical protein
MGLPSRRDDHTPVGLGVSRASALVAVLPVRERAIRENARQSEAEAAAADPDDLAEALRVRQEMDSIAAALTDAPYE